MSKPFLKWAGGKSRLLSVILPLLVSAERLVEPFCGSAAVSLGSSYEQLLLTDVNQDLIRVFRYLRDEGKCFIEDCRNEFSYRSKEEYLARRAEFNSTADWYRKSILFVYLNRHCFNGLCRYNRSGKFNVPFGDYKEPYFPAKEMESARVSLAEAVIKCQDFRATFEDLRKRDVVYCDPPYIPISSTSSFTSYAKDGFSWDDHLKLVELAKKSTCRVLISNADTQATRELYRDADDIVNVEASRTISCKGSERKKVRELIAVYAPHPAREVARSLADHFLKTGQFRQ